MKEKKQCRKVRFSDENSALFTLRKINETSNIKNKPKRAYLCKTCNSWHLTSKPDFFAIQDENLKLKKHIQELEKRINDLMSEDGKNVREKIKKDSEVKQLKHVNNLTMKKLQEERKSNRDFINRISVSVSLLEKCFLPENLQCDGAFCMGCWKDLVNQSLKQLKNNKNE